MARTVQSHDVAPEDRHLLPGFDPNTLRVAELRGILLEHDVHAAGNAKKPDLVRIFREQVAPRAADILRARRGVVASGRGIQRIRNQEQQTITTSSSTSLSKRGQRKRGRALADLSDSSTDEEQQDVKTYTGKGKGRATAHRPSVATPKRIQLEPESESSSGQDDLEMPPVLPEKKSVRTGLKSGQNPVVTVTRDATESPDRKKPRKTYNGESSTHESTSETPAKRRKSDFVGPPQVAHDVTMYYSRSSEKEQPILADSPNTSGFSDYNPFQSGSPDPESRSVRKRKSSANLASSRLSMDTDPPLGKTPRSPSLLSVADKAPRPTSPLNPQSSTFAQPKRRLSEYVADMDDEYKQPSLLQAAREQTPPKPDDRIKRLQSIPAHISREIHQKDNRRSSAPQPRINLDEEEQRQQIQHRQSVKKRASLEPSQLARDRQQAMQPMPKSFPVQRKSALSKSLTVTPQQSSSNRLLPRQVQKASWMAMAITCLIYALWWRQERLSIGYCDTGSTSNREIQQRRLTLAESAAPSSSLVTAANAKRLGLTNIDYIRPTCMPCPAHGMCVDGRLLACERDYIQQPNFWASATLHLLPMPDRCLPDTERLTRVAELASMILRSLQQRRGNLICSGHVPSSKKLRKEGTREIDVFGIQTEELAMEMRPQFENRISADNWDDYFSSAIRELVKEDGDATTGEDTEGRQVIAAINAEYPLACRARVKAYEYAAKRKTAISQTLGVLLAILWARSTLKQYQREGKRVTDLTNTAFRLLQQQKYRYKTGAADEPYFGVMRMRDQLLATEHALSVRKRVWQKVSRIVESNDNVRSSEVDHEGQPLRAWEWCGNVNPNLEWDGTPTKRHLRFAGDADDQSSSAAPIYPKLE